ncbi:MAG: hypothetical protein M3068_08920 [Gemmatimonadota bacterium]|nr:hypothetical protein [Gemmatimonadota bacterium]
MARSVSPAEGRAVLALMRDALVDARVSLGKLREGVDATRARLEGERSELDTVRRRGTLASGIGDQETVAVAARFEQRHAERVVILERKLAAQQEELAMAEREVEEMTLELKNASVAGAPSGSPRAPDLPESNPESADGLRRTVERVAREADAQRQLEELKRRMGK